MALSKNKIQSCYMEVMRHIDSINGKLDKEKSKVNGNFIEARMEALMTSFTRYLEHSNSYIESLENMPEDRSKETSIIRTDQTNLEEQYYGVLALCKSFVQEVKELFKTAKAEIEHTIINPVAEISHAVKIPKFDGTRSAWFDWRGYFVAGVHEKNFSAFKKMTMLKEALSGRAADLINNILPNEEGYQKAWALLEEHYSNKKVVIKEYLSTLINLPHMNSADEMEAQLIEVKRCLMGIESCGKSLENWDTILVYLVSEKLDKKSKIDFEIEYPSTDDLPTWNQLKNFMQARSIVATNNSYTAKPVSNLNNEQRNRQVSIKNNTFNSQSNIPTYKCYACTQYHRLYACETYKQASIDERKRILNNAGACLNCLNPSHSVSNCSRSPTCTMCNSMHHSSLHPNPPKRSFWFKEQKIVKSSVNINSSQQPVLLPTALIKIVSNQHSNIIRCLLDSCSQSNLISENYILKHRLPTIRTNNTTEISGIGGKYISNKMCKIQIISEKKNYIIQAVVIPSKINYILSNVNNDDFNKLRNEKLADKIYSYPTINIDGIDLLLGAEMYNEVVLDETRIVRPYKLRNTIFGWTVARLNEGPNANTTHMNANSTAACVGVQLERYWEMDEEIKKEKSDLEYCEEHFKNNTLINDEGQFVVKYPFLPSYDMSTLLGNYKTIRFITMKLINRLHGEQREMYEKFLQEYLALGHMKPLMTNDLNSVHFIPHHPVFRASSTTTKLRVVFNASWINKNGITLNQCMAVGPVVQPELVDSLFRFRQYPVAFSADIEKMFRCICVNEEQQKFQCIFGMNGEPYQLTTVTYGTSSAPFLATRCLKEVANELYKTDTRAAKIIESAYMDDILGGGRTIEETIEIRSNIHNALEKAGFHLRKYQSNNSDVLNSIPAKLLETLTEKSIGNEESLSILGIKWIPKIDELQLQSQFNEPCPTPTKRNILSEISKIFDPMNLAAPVTVRGRLLMQKVWKGKYKWDETVKEALALEFIKLRLELNCLEQKTISRYVGDVSQAELFGYCDASLIAYGAVVYLRTKNSEDQIKTTLIAAKSRVAPLKKPLTIPKLELQSAVELVKLILRISKEYCINKEKIILFSDSKVALDWIAQPTKKWTSFVKTRVLKINNEIPVSNWYYCPTKENPADLLTRGIDVQSWLTSELWFHGPKIIQEGTTYITAGRIWRTELIVDGVNTLEEKPEENKISVNIVVEKENDLLKWVYSKSNSRAAIRILGRVWMFLYKCKKQGIDKASSYEQGAQSIYRMIQHTEYQEEIKCLKTKKPLNNKSKLLRLNPFMDNSGIVRSSSRLRNGPFSKNRVEPIILPANNTFVKVLIQHLHKSLLHTTANVIEEYLWSKFVFTGSLRKVVKTLLHNCIECIRHYKLNHEQIMGALPADRLVMERAFHITGVDGAGPFTIKCTNHRSTKHLKYYIVLFICFSSRAVHIEPLCDLTTSSFLCALGNFVHRRGRPAVIYSDNGTNFKGAANRLDLADQKLQSAAADQGMRWKFNLPSTPHRGGLWEAAIKSAKRHLMSVLQNEVLTTEQFIFTITKVEAILNSRPILYRTAVDDRQEVITPGHALIGDHLLHVPELNSKTPVSLTRMYEKVLQRIRDFWNIWRKDYVNQLAIRQKWKRPFPNIKCGQLVLLRKYNPSGFKWPMGLVTDVKTDSQGNARTVIVKLENKIEEIAVQHLVPLPVEEHLPGETVSHTPPCG